MPALMYNITHIARCAAQYRSEEMAPFGLKACHASYIVTICRHPGAGSIRHLRKTLQSAFHRCSIWS